MNQMSEKKNRVITLTDMEYKCLQDMAEANKCFRGSTPNVSELISRIARGEIQMGDQDSRISWVLGEMIDIEERMAEIADRLQK